MASKQGRLKGPPIVAAGVACHIAGMARAEISSPRRTRAGAALLVAALHAVAIFALIHAFAPKFTAQVSDRVTAVFTVEVTAPPPPPAAAEPEPPGASGAQGKQAVPKEVSPPRLVVASPRPAPPISGQGHDQTSGARDSGAGTGAGGQGLGTGSGNGGNGQGGGADGKATKISGEINSARDYPKKTRELRLGDYVVVALTVGIDGRVKACRIHRASRDAEADRITCRLATERFRFRPATNAAGEPIDAVFGWQQRWFDPREKDGAQKD